MRWIAVNSHTIDLHLADSCCIGSGMAFLARNLLMLAAEHKGRAGMAEPGSRFPGLLVVTAEAIGAELILMRLLVARCTLALQAKEGLVEIFQLDLGADCGCDLCRGMAALAFLLAVLAFQWEARLGAMIETLPVQRDEREFRTAMLDMAARAIRLAGRTFVGTRVKAHAHFYSALNLNVTFEALETARSKIVAGCALGDTLHLRVSARQGSR